MAAVKTICDTDVLIDYFDANQQRHQATREILEEKIGLDSVVLSAITKMELITGARNKAELNTINKKLSRFDTLLIDISRSAAESFAMQIKALLGGSIGEYYLTLSNEKYLTVKRRHV